MPGEGQGLLALAQSADIARAMSSICNDVRATFGVMSGHDRKTLSLSAPVGNVPPEVPPLIELGSLASPAFDPVHFSGSLYAFDAPVRVGAWEVILGPVAVAEPASLALVALGLASIGWVRRLR